MIRLFEKNLATWKDSGMKEHKPKYAIRFSTRNFEFENNIKSIPIHVAFCVE